jgi:hypothetical protein
MSGVRNSPAGDPQHDQAHTGRISAPSPRDKARERRISLVERREAIFELAASGYSIETIAARFGLAPRMVRRAIDATVTARRLDSPQHFVHLQIARLMKALRAAEAAVDRNDLRGVAGMVKIVAQLDKYHRPALAAPATQPALPAPTLAPLALRHEPEQGVEAVAAR